MLTSGIREGGYRKQDLSLRLFNPHEQALRQMLTDPQETNKTLQ